MLRRITLHLARSPGNPNGNPRDGYDISVPLDEEGRLEPEFWRVDRDRCRVRRFRPGERDRHGWLLHRAGGAGGARWVIDYDDSTDDDNEVVFKLDSHRIAVGEYLSIRTGSGELVPFHISTIRPLGRISLKMTGSD